MWARPRAVVASRVRTSPALAALSIARADGPRPRMARAREPAGRALTRVLRGDGSERMFRRRERRALTYTRTRECRRSPRMFQGLWWLKSAVLWCAKSITLQVRDARPS